VAEETTPDSHRPGGAGADDARLSRWAAPCGAALLVSLVVPTASLDGGRRLALTWPWTRWPDLDATAAVSAAGLAAAGLALVGLAAARPGRARAAAILAASAGALVAFAGAAGAFHDAGEQGGRETTVQALSLAVLCALLAAGNHRRKDAPHSAGVRAWAAAAGAIGVALALRPPLEVGAMVTRGSWAAAWPALAAASLCLLHLATGVLHLLPGRGAVTAVAVSAIGRLAALSLPLSFALNPLLVPTTPDFDPDRVLGVVGAALNAAKSPVLAPYPALVALGLAAAALSAPDPGRGRSP
jgi:hypothetical protein